MLSREVLLVIAALAGVTYVTKAGGLWLLERIELSDGVEVWLEALPGAILVAILVPELVAGGPREWAAGAVVLAVAYRTSNILLTILVGVGTILLFRRGLFFL